MPARRRVSCIPCRVEFYAGSRAEETPRRVIYRGQTAVVERILGRKRAMDKSSGMTADIFTLILEGRVVTLRPMKSGGWALFVPRP